MLLCPDCTRGVSPSGKHAGKRARWKTRPVRFASHVSDVRLEERALLSSAVSLSAGTMPLTVLAHADRGPVRLLHPARRDPPKIRLHSRAILILRARDARIIILSDFFRNHLCVIYFVIVSDIISKTISSNYLIL